MKSDFGPRNTRSRFYVQHNQNVASTFSTKIENRRVEGISVLVDRRENERVRDRVTLLRVVHLA